MASSSCLFCWCGPLYFLHCLASWIWWSAIPALVARRTNERTPEPARRTAASWSCWSKLSDTIWEIISEERKYFSEYYGTLHALHPWNYSENQKTVGTWNLFRKLFLFFDQPQTSLCRFWLEKSTLSEKGLNFILISLTIRKVMRCLCGSPRNPPPPHPNEGHCTHSHPPPSPFGRQW